MTTSITKTATIIGIDAHVIEVEADVSIGLGAFNIVGLPDGSIKESKDRVMAALNNACGGFPIRKVVINLAPADIRKVGTGFDLPIAMAVLEASKSIPVNALRETLIIGELSLEGRIKPIDGIQQLRDAFPFDQAPKFFIMDRDCQGTLFLSRCRLRA